MSYIEQQWELDLTQRIVRKLENVCQDLALLKAQGNIEGFFNNTENADNLSSLLEDIRDAMLEYQVCNLRSTCMSHISNGRTRLRYSKISMTKAVSSL